MKTAIVGDVHLSRYGQDAEGDSGGSEKLQSIQASLYEIANFCKEKMIKNIIITGDIYHNKSFIYAVAQNIFINFLKDFPDIHFYVIDGNHDLSGKVGKVVSSLKGIEDRKNVTWITATDGNVSWQHPTEDILFVPYSEFMVDVIKKSKADILISHFGLNEGMLNSGISIRSNISIKDLQEHYKHVFLGHYHKPQEYIGSDIHVYYIGSIIQLDWGEKDDIKRFIVYDTKHMKVSSIPINNYKKHIEIEVNKSNQKEAIERALKAKEQGDHVKIIVTESITLPNDLGVSIIDRSEKDITNRGISANMNQNERLKKYLMIRDIKEEQHDKFIKLANEVIDACAEEQTT
jgi:DNA repair exonuclease SbcCD nuclease subunit